MVLYNENMSELDWVNNITLYDPSSQATIEQFRNNNIDRLRLRVSPSLIQTLSNNWSFTVGASVGINEGILKREEGSLNDSNEFDEIPIPDFQTRESFIQPSIAFNRASNKSQLNFNFEFLNNGFDKVLDNVTIDKPNYVYFLPSISYQNEYRTGRRMNARYYTSVNMPSVTQLNPVVDSINQLTIFKGNVNLQPEYNHNLAATWSLFDQFSFTSVTARLYGTYTKNKIRWSQELSEDLVRINTPLNVKSNTLLMSEVYFATPIRSLGLNLSMTSREIWSRGSVFINGEENINTNLTHTLSLRLENRNNEKLSINVSAAINLTDSRFSIARDQNNVYFNTSFTSDLRYTPNKKWSFQAKADVLNYNARSFGEAVSVPLMTASISYFFMQAEKASVTLSGFDLLDKYIGFQRISDTNFLMQRQWNTIGQYAMLTFRMRMR